MLFIRYDEMCDTIQSVKTCSISSYDWQLGSVPLISSILDVRNLSTCATILIGSLLLHRSAISNR